MKLFTKEERKELIERVALNFHKDGIKHLEKVQCFEKYLPQYHFGIFQPGNGDHIFATELFGNKEFVPKLPGGCEGYRIQYHGDYDGLNSAVCVQIKKSMITSKNDKRSFGDDLHLDRSQRKSGSDLAFEARRVSAFYPTIDAASFIPLGSDRNLDRRLRESFDNSLHYLYLTLGVWPCSAEIVKNFRIEQIKGTYNVC